MPDVSWRRFMSAIGCTALVLAALPAAAQIAQVDCSGRPIEVFVSHSSSKQALTREDEPRDSLAAKRVELRISTPAAVRRHTDRDEDKWGKLIRDLGLKETS